MMTSGGGVSGTIGSPLPKWQLALAVGAPVAALGLGYMYYKNSTKSPAHVTRGKQKGTANGTADKQISIDGDSAAKTTETESPSEKLLREANSFKEEGNKYFKSGKYDEAIAKYNQAILLCPEEYAEQSAIFYQNRAASYEQLNKYTAVKEDCTVALKLKPLYVKAMLRRAVALEHCNELETSLEDLTAACILERFSNQRTLAMADQILKKLGRQHAEEYMLTKKPAMPSEHFINNYFIAFNNDPIISILDKLETVDTQSDISKAIQALKEQRFDDIIPLCTKEIERLQDGFDDLEPLKVSELDGKLKAHLLRGTFYLLSGQHEKAIDDLTLVIESKDASKEFKVNALIKRATMSIQLEEFEQTFKDFEKAVELYPECGDIYHNRGQVNLLMENVDQARDDFQKAVDLNPNLGLVYVQKCFTDFRYAITKKDMSLVDKALHEFEKALKKFPDCSECYTLYAQMLSDMQEFAKADSYYSKAIEKDPKNATIYVQRGMLQIQWNGNVDKAVEYIKQALQLDKKCELGYETLGTIEVQRGHLKEAISLFDEALVLCRTVMELTHIFGLKNAAKTQLTVTERLGTDFVRNMSLML